MNEGQIYMCIVHKEKGGGGGRMEGGYTEAFLKDRPDRMTRRYMGEGAQTPCSIGGERRGGGRGEV